mmetsp:Transcript_41618/g.134487  ORF Transcript_41618/g.134487 Transcript_41618/m.134487 type:complete len:354 (-) Transcript_41618:233-1294(-)
MMTPAVTVVSATVAPGSAPTGVGAPDMPRIAGSINGMAVLAPAAGAAESPAGMGPSRPSAGVGSEVISGSGPSAESALGRGRLDTVESDASGAITDWRSAVRSEPLSTFGTEEPPLLSGWAAASPVGGGVAEPLRPRPLPRDPSSPPSPLPLRSALPPRPLPPRSRMPGVELEPSSGATASALAGGAGDGDGSNTCTQFFCWPHLLSATGAGLSTAGAGDGLEGLEAAEGGGAVGAGLPFSVGLSPLGGRGGRSRSSPSRPRPPRPPRLRSPSPLPRPRSPLPPLPLPPPSASSPLGREPREGGRRSSARLPACSSSARRALVGFLLDVHSVSRFLKTPDPLKNLSTSTTAWS